MKKISIIIPVYNAEKFIERCLGSIKIQSYNNYEIILVNDQSSDDTLSLLEEYKNQNQAYKITILNTVQNSGPSGSRNLGIEQAKGDFIFFIDADDDLPNSSVLQDFIDKTFDYPDVVIGETHFFVKNILTQSKYHNLQNKKVSYKYNEILDGFFNTEWASTVWNKLYDINFIKKNNLRFADGLLHEDELWVFQFSALAKKVNFLNKKTYNYYYSNSGSITGNVGLKNMVDYKNILCEELKFSKKEDLFIRNKQTEVFLRNFAKQILLAKVSMLDYSFFKNIYNELRSDFKDYFPRSDEFNANPLVAFYLYKMKFDENFFLYGKLPKYVNPLLKI